jgi:acyl dehydratase
MRDHSKLIGAVIDEQVATVTVKDTLLYALGLGFGADPLDERQLRYVYEENLCSLPGMAMTLAYPGFWMGDPEYGFDWQKVLHAEESIEIYQPLPVAGIVRGKTIVEDIVDRGVEKGCFVYLRKEHYLEDGTTHLASVISNTAARGDGGFGGGGKPRAAMPAPPQRAADVVCDLPTLPQSALLYRLSGDMNPLHADPTVARGAGFDAPILHGRCTMGVAMHALIRSCCDYDASRLRSMRLRFSAPFMPGETLRTEIWQDGDMAYFRAASLERNVVVLNNGSARIVS